MVLGPAGPLDHLPDGLTSRREFRGHSRVHPRPRPLPLPLQRSRRYQYRPSAAVQRLWELLSCAFQPPLATHRLHLRGWMPMATLQNCSSPIPSRVIHMPIGCANSRPNRRATPQCVTSPSDGRRPCRSTFCRATPRTSVLPFQTSRNWLVKDGCTRQTTTSSFSSVTRPRRRRGPPSLARWGVLLVC